MSNDLLSIPGEGSFQLIKSLVGFKTNIEKQLERFPYEENVFMMLKFRESNRALSDFIIENLKEAGLRGVRADSEDWDITGDVYNPLAVLYCCKFGIALFDEPEKDQEAYSPNVAYELGIMHYQGKQCLILRHTSLPPVPFDLIKNLHKPYDRDLTVRSIVQNWVKRITEAPGSLQSFPDVPRLQNAAENAVEPSSALLSGSHFAFQKLAPNKAGGNWKFEWKIRVRYLGSEHQRVHIRIEYYDADEYLVAFDNKYPKRPLASGEERPVSNRHDVKDDAAKRIQRAKAIISEWLSTPSGQTESTTRSSSRRRAEVAERLKEYIEDLERLVSEAKQRSALPAEGELISWKDQVLEYLDANISRDAATQLHEITTSRGSGQRHEHFEDSYKEHIKILKRWQRQVASGGLRVKDNEEPSGSVLPRVHKFTYRKA